MVQNFQDCVNRSDKSQTRRYRICGIVQGVGFRPFVHKLAKNFNIVGWVLNDSEGVVIELQSSLININSFITELEFNPPPMAKITSILEIIRDNDLQESYQDFRILKSRKLKNLDTIGPPDSNVCEDCLNEMKDPNNKRFRYAFINCTNCGPRYSIIKEMPYDRSQTTMNSFEMCLTCQREYNDIENRRYHAQPNACPVCGPNLDLVSKEGNSITTDDIIKFSIDRLLEGAILAIKSLGGFHLVVDANNKKAIELLRKRKKRDSKPFAVMVLDVKNALRIAFLNKHEKELLESVQRPIVILRKLPKGLPEEIAPHNPNIGVMLPSTPLQYLMLEDKRISALVMTSGNISGNPIVIDNSNALKELNGVADYFILNNRDIYTRVDDSVIKVVNHKDNTSHHLLYLRRSRGYAPYPIHLQNDVPPIIALGAELKTTVSVAKGNKVFMSQHIGDLKNDNTFQSHINCINHMQKLLNINSDVLACDLHPSFRSTQNALNQPQRRVVKVQHHHAHMASCMVENGVSGKTIGVIFDGTGYGLDGTIWGGEFLVGDIKSFERAAHLHHMALPGGDKAVKEPIRVAVALLTETYGENNINEYLSILNSLSIDELKVFSKMAAKKIHSPVTSSMGRLFDGIAALIGVCTHIEYEAQAAIELEALLCNDLKMDKPFKFDILEYNDHIEIDYRPIIKDLVKFLKSDFNNLSRLSRRFHSTIVEIIIKVCEYLSKLYGTKQVVLSGGVFNNEFLLVNSIDRLKDASFDVYYHQLVPTSDGGISLGQIAVASCYIE